MDTICRMCLEESEELHSIFTDNIPSKIKEISGVEVRF